MLWRAQLERRLAAVSAERDAYLHQRDEALGERNELRRQLDIAIGERNEYLRQRDIAIGERNECLRQRDIAIGERNEYLRQRDIAIGERNEYLRQRDIAIGNEYVRQCDIAIGERNVLQDRVAKQPAFIRDELIEAAVKERDQARYEAADLRVRCRNLMADLERLSRQRSGGGLTTGSTTNTGMTESPSSTNPQAGGPPAAPRQVPQNGGAANATVPKSR
jgi:hypothetical protein